MATIGSLAINVLARTGAFSRGMGKVRGELRGFGKLGRGLNVLLGPVGVGLAGVGAAGFSVAKGIQAATGFQSKLANSLAIMGDVSGETRDKMVKAAQDVAFSTKFSASDAAEAYFFLASAGLDAEASLAALPKVAAFAQAGNFDLALATDLLTDAQSALGLSSKDAAENMKNMTRVSDVLVKANTLANASVEQFSQSLTNKAGAALRVVGKDIEEGVAVLAAFADQGVKGQEAGTALNIVMRDLQTKALQNAAAFKAAGVAVFDQAEEMRTMAAIVGDLERKLDGMSDATKKATLLQLGFTDKSIAFIQTLLGTSEKIAGYEKALRSAGGTTKEVADKQLTPFATALNKIKAIFEELSINVLGPALDALGDAISVVLDQLRGAGGIGENFGKALRSGIETAAIAFAKLLDQIGTFEEIGLRLKSLEFAFRAQFTFDRGAAATFQRQAELFSGQADLLKSKRLASGGLEQKVRDAFAGVDTGIVEKRREEARAAFAAGIEKHAAALGKTDQAARRVNERAAELGKGGFARRGPREEVPLATSRFEAIGKALELKAQQATIPFEKAANQLALRGSSEAVSAIQQFRFRGGKESVDKEQLKAQQKGNEIARRHLAATEDLRDNLRTFGIPAGTGAAA